MKFENILGKKVKELEVLSESLVYRERELLVKYKDKLEEVDLEENTAKYENKGLLDEVSSDDEEDDDPEYYGSMNGSRNKGSEMEDYKSLKHNKLNLNYDDDDDDDDEEENYTINLDQQDNK